MRFIYNYILNNLKKKNNIIFIPIFIFNSYIKKIINKIITNEVYLYYVDFSKYKVVKKFPFFTKIIFNYIETAEIDKSLDLVFKKFSHLDKLDFEFRVFEFMVENIKYDDNHEKNSYTIYNPLFKGYGVCEGIASLFALLCYMKGIKCIKRLGKIGNVPHMWNVIFIDDKAYNVDVTTGITFSRNKIKMGYLNVPDHFLDGFVIKDNLLCNSLDKNPYIIFGLSFKSKDELVGKINYYSSRKERIIMLNISSEEIDYTTYLLSLNFNFDFQFTFIERYLIVLFYHNWIIEEV